MERNLKKGFFIFYTKNVDIKAKKRFIGGLLIGINGLDCIIT